MQHKWDDLPGTGWSCKACGALKRVSGNGEWASTWFEYRARKVRKWTAFAPRCFRWTKPGTPPMVPGDAPEPRDMAHSLLGTRCRGTSLDLFDHRMECNAMVEAIKAERARAKQSSNTRP
jgi:hypothetical protein